MRSLWNNRYWRACYTVILKKSPMTFISQYVFTLTAGTMAIAIALQEEHLQNRKPLSRRGAYLDLEVLG
jgi:hypothetical protein